MASEPIGVERAKEVTGQDPEEPPVENAAPGLPIRVAAVNDYEVVVAGLATMLARFPDRLHVCEAVLEGEPVHADGIDVALFDTYGRDGIGESTLRRVSAMEGIHAVAVFTIDVTPRLVEDALAAGARSVLSKKLSGEELADALVRVAFGEVVIEDGEGRAGGTPGDDAVDWPGRAEGLSVRESEVLALLAQGLSNRDIAKSLYVGEETIKTHVRQVLHKLGVHNRTQAAVFALGHVAFRPGTQPAARP